uniref:Uncharacterized protein n=1 Tax=Globodera rostochiensis TaxID=31243 RepID=A0A914HK26_GLORO
MHLSPVDIGNVAKFNIGEQLERRRRSVQLVVGPPWGDDLKLPPAPRRQSLVERCQTSLRKSKVAFSPGNFSTPFLPPIVPKSASATSALSPPFSANTLRFRRQSAFSRASPLPPLFLSVLNDAKNDEGEEEEEEKPISGSSAISSNQREPLRRPLIIETFQPNCQPAEVFNEDADVEQSPLTFDTAQELLLVEQKSPQLVRKLDVVRCRRMANKMINELLERLQQKNLPKQTGGDEKNTQKQNKQKKELAMAELQRDFFPYVYAKAERLVVHRMANSFLDGTLENSAASKY